MKAYYIYLNNTQYGPYYGVKELQDMELSLDTQIWDSVSEQWTQLRNHIDRNLIYYEFPKNFILHKQKKQKNFFAHTRNLFVTYVIISTILLAVISFALAPSTYNIENKGMEFQYAEYQYYILRLIESIIDTTYIYESEDENPIILFVNMYVASFFIIAIPFAFYQLMKYSTSQTKLKNRYNEKIINWLKLNTTSVIQESIYIDFNGTSFSCKEIVEGKVEEFTGYVSYNEDGDIVVQVTK